MTIINQAFKTTMTIGNDAAIRDTVDVAPSSIFPRQSTMCIVVDNKTVYITKQQAMDFFGLKDPMGVRHNLD